MFERADSSTADADKSGASLTVGANWPISFGDVSTSSTAGVLDNSMASPNQQRQPTGSTSSPTRKSQSDTDLLSTSGGTSLGPGNGGSKTSTGKPQGQQRQPTTAKPTAGGDSAESLPARSKNHPAAPGPNKQRQKQKLSSQEVFIIYHGFSRSSF